jgi:transcriptional regulator with XRE-family HTH domain
MQTKTDDKQMREYRRQMLRGEFRSLFWAIFSDQKRKKKFTLQAFADKLGIGKSSLSRGFNEPQNWTIDKMADMADALGVELIVEARDSQSGVVFTPTGSGRYAHTGTTADASNISVTRLTACSSPRVAGVVSGSTSLVGRVNVARAA